MSVYHFKRNDGSTFAIDVTINEAKVAEDIARSMARTGKKRATKSSGGIVAKVVEV